MGNVKHFGIPENVAQAVLNYLAGRPYSEVYQLVHAMQAMREATPVPTEAELAAATDMPKD